MNIYSVDVYLVRRGREDRMRSYFVAPDDERAIRDAHRWGENRREAMDELLDGGDRHFLGCVKLYHFLPREIDASGYIGPSTSFWFHEWKYDWPMAGQQHAQLLEQPPCQP